MALTHHILGLAESLGLQSYLVVTKFNIFLKCCQAFNESRRTDGVTRGWAGWIMPEMLLKFQGGKMLVKA